MDPAGKMCQPLLPVCLHMCTHQSAKVTTWHHDSEARVDQDVIQAEKPFLGICLGLQLLFDISYEGGEFEGLGIIPGKVKRFNVRKGFKVPHMGWNQANIVRDAPILEGIDFGTHFYFVHSYYVVPSNDHVIAVTSDYDGEFCSMIWQNNLFATQFHPEKSQAAGIKVLNNFGSL